MAQTSELESDTRTKSEPSAAAVASTPATTAPASAPEPTTSENDAKRAAQSHALAVDASFKRYGIDRWGRDFLTSNSQGHLVFSAPGCPTVDLHVLSLELARRGIRTPYVVRFPTMIERQMETLKSAFARRSPITTTRARTSACTR